MFQAFQEHPRSVGETYSEHFGHALGFGVKMVVAGFACILHGFFPFLFKTTGSHAIKKLHDSMVTNRIRKPVDASRSPSGAH